MNKQPIIKPFVPVYYWTNRQVLSWARYYVSNVVTLVDMENQLGVSHSTLWWCFQNRLPLLDVQLYSKVIEKLDYNKRNKPIHKEGK